MITYLRVAYLWRRMMLKWWDIEMELPLPPNAIQQKRKLVVRLRKIFIIVTCLSLIEHILGVVATIFASVLCPIDPNDKFKSFFIEHLPIFFEGTSYSHLKAILAKCANLVNTFLWFYVDLFVMLVAVGLSSIFKLYCDYLVQYKGQITAQYFWDEQRINYRKLCELVEYVDKVISPVTIVSFSNNLYFVCLQLMNVLK